MIWLIRSAGSSCSRTTGGRVSKKSCWAASRGTSAVVSGAVSVGSRTPTTSNGTPRRSIVSPAADAVLAGEVGAQHDDVAALVGLGERAALGVVENEVLETLVGAGDMSDDLVRHAEAAAELSSSQRTVTDGTATSTPSIAATAADVVTSIGAMPKLPPDASLTTILSPKYRLPPSTSALILLAIEPKTTSAQMPMVMPEIVRTVRSLRRDRFRSSFIVPPGWL